MPLTVAEIDGYAGRDLDADLARWFPDQPRVSLPADIRSAEPFLARLPSSAAASLAAFDRRVRSGTMPQFLDVYDWSYGFDFQANDCRILDSDYETELSDDDVWSIGADGGGNYHVVLADGRVALWFHEEEVVEGGTRYDNLDVFLWSQVRFHAVRRGVLDLAAVEADFRALGQPGVLAPGIGLLASLS